jgi:hypothetical protein
MTDERWTTTGVLLGLLLLAGCPATEQGQKEARPAQAQPADARPADARPAETRPAKAGAPPGLPAGKASGTLTAGSKTISLQHAYVEQPTDKTAYNVYLTNVPMSPENLARKGAIHIVRLTISSATKDETVRIESDGLPLVEDDWHGVKRTRGGSTTVVGGATFQATHVGPEGVAGTVNHPTQKVPEGTFAYTATFHVRPTR